MKKTLIFRGVATALITPFNDKGMDYISLAKIIEFQLTHGVDALVVCGTTGESATLTDDEKKELIDFTVRQTRKRVPVIAGTGSNDTKKACAMSEYAAKAGADGLLVVTPYYNKCTQKGLIDYYSSVSSVSGLPYIAYSVPSRTGVKIDPETCRGLKDAGDSISDTAKVISLCGESLPVYSGNDDRVIPILSLGGKGVISVMSNIIPLETKMLCQTFFDGNTHSAAYMQTKLIPLCNALFSEVNPIPIKALMAEKGFCKNIVRPPLTLMTTENKIKLLKAFHEI